MIVVGSRGRAELSADAWSDLDIVMFCADPAVYTHDPGWLARLGESRLTLLQHPNEAHPEWLVMLVNGHRADIKLADVPVDAGAALTLLDRGVCCECASLSKQETLITYPLAPSLPRVVRRWMYRLA